MVIWKVEGFVCLVVLVKEELCEKVMKIGSMNASVICLFGSFSEGGAV